MCLYNPRKSLDYDYHYPYNKDLGIQIGQYDCLKEIPSDLFMNRGTQAIGQACWYLVSYSQTLQGKFFKT